MNKCYQIIEIWLIFPRSDPRTVASCNIEGYGVNPGVDIAKGRLHGSVTRDTGKPGEGRGADADGEMAGARTVVARVTCVAVAFVDDGQFGRRKCACQAIFNLLFYLHFAATPSLIRQNA